MSEKNTLNEKDLEEVAGGAYKGYKSPEEVVFNYQLGQAWEIPKMLVYVHQHTIGAIITQRGYTYIPEHDCYEPCYYLKANKANEDVWSGWYGECTLDKKTTTYENKQVKGSIVTVD